MASNEFLCFYHISFMMCKKTKNKMPNKQCTNLIYLLILFGKIRICNVMKQKQSEISF